MADVLIKRPNEQRAYYFEFKNFPELTGGDSLASSPVATVTADVTGLTLGAPSVSGTKVTLTISGGADQTAYLLTCKATTVAGSVLEAKGRLKVEGE